jgi:hypothetical protein
MRLFRRGPRDRDFLIYLATPRPATMREEIVARLRRSPDHLEACDRVAFWLAGVSLPKRRRLTIARAARFIRRRFGRPQVAFPVPDAPVRVALTEGVSPEFAEPYEKSRPNPSYRDAFIQAFVASSLRGVSTETNGVIAGV